MTLEAYEMLTHGDDRDRDAVAGTQDPQPLGRGQDLIAVHMKDSEGVCRRHHPRLECPDRRLFDSDLPTGRSPGNFPAEGMADHLGSKADTHEFAALTIEPSHQVGQGDHPGNVLVDRMTRSGGDPGITLVEIERELPGEEVEYDKFDLRPIGKEAGEEFRVVPGDDPEPGPNMVAKEKAKLHERRVGEVAICVPGFAIRDPLSAIRQTGTPSLL